MAKNLLAALVIIFVLSGGSGGVLYGQGKAMELIFPNRELSHTHGESEETHQEDNAPHKEEPHGLDEEDSHN